MRTHPLTVQAAYERARAIWPDRTIVVACTIHSELTEPCCSLTFLRGEGSQFYGPNFEDCISRAQKAKV